MATIKTVRASWRASSFSIPTRISGLRSSCTFVVRCFARISLSKRRNPRGGGGRSKGGAACMILFCPFEQMHYYIELGQRYGLKRYIPLVFRKDFSAQVLKANMKVVGNCEYGLILYRDRLPKFNNDGRMIFNCFDWVRDTDTPKIHPTQKPVPLLERLIEIFTDKGDVVIDPCAGSGTTLLAAANMGRKAYGFEIKKDFCAEARVKVLPRISKSLFV